MSEIDEYTGKPYAVDVAHVLAARKLWKKYYNTPGSSERSFVHVIAPVLASLARQEEGALGEAVALIRKAKDACTYDSDDAAAKGIYGLPIDVLIPMTLFLEDRESARPEDGGITQALVEMARTNAIEECAAVCDAKAPEWRRNCGMNCESAARDCASAIRALKDKPSPQKESP